MIDQTLLQFFNRALATPLLDGVMLAATVLGPLLFWLIGGFACLYGDPARQRWGRAVLISQLLGLLGTAIFYYLALRPRPVDVRLLLPAPPFPSFPSGHTVLVCAGAAVILLARPARRWRAATLLAATIIPISRLYLGHHFPTDVLAGALLGAAIGAACYGVLLGDGSPLQRVRWLLWPQIAVAALVTEMAYLDLLPTALLRWPWADKALHFLLFGAIVFWLNLWWVGRKWRVGHRAIPLAIGVVLTIAAGEELLQGLSPYRTLDLVDLVADLAGMIMFWWASERLVEQTADCADLRRLPTGN